MRKSGVPDVILRAGQAPPLNDFVRGWSVWNSGKLLILGIVALAVLMAGASWWYRYRATHRAAEFWGPRASQLIRDAPQVTLLDLESGDQGMPVDISKARGLIHLRYALLEDRSYEWRDPKSSDRPRVSSPRWLLTFADPAAGEAASIRFSNDCQVTELVADESRAAGISCSPIAAGLSDVFAEYSAGVAAAVR